jgi:hypothetical protein
MMAIMATALKAVITLLLVLVGASFLLVAPACISLSGPLATPVGL